MDRSTAPRHEHRPTALIETALRRARAAHSAIDVLEAAMHPHRRDGPRRHRRLSRRGAVVGRDGLEEARALVRAGRDLLARRGIRTWIETGSEPGQGHVATVDDELDHPRADATDRLAALARSIAAALDVAKAEWTALRLMSDGSA